MKVVLDTNVLVSGLLKPRSNPARSLRLVLQEDVQIITNEHVLAEYFEVRHFPKKACKGQKVVSPEEFLRQLGKSKTYPKAL